MCIHMIPPDMDYDSCCGSGPGTMPRSPGPLWVPWALVGWALVGPLGPYVPVCIHLSMCFSIISFVYLLGSGLPPA